MKNKFKPFDIVKFNVAEKGEKKDFRYGIFCRYLPMDEFINTTLDDLYDNEKELSIHDGTPGLKFEKDKKDIMKNLFKDLGIADIFQKQNPLAELLMGNPEKEDEWIPVEVEIARLSIAILPSMRFKNWLKKKAKELKDENKAK